MDIHIPNRDLPYTWAEAVAPGTGASRLVKVSTGSWAVEVCIPFLAFGAGVVPNTNWSCALCRYNYGPGEDGKGNIVKDGTVANITQPACTTRAAPHTLR
jgi:hypothetical protein